MSHMGKNRNILGGFGVYFGTIKESKMWGAVNFTFFGDEIYNKILLKFT